MRLQIGPPPTRAASAAIQQHYVVLKSMRMRTYVLDHTALGLETLFFIAAEVRPHQRHLSHAGTRRDPVMWDKEKFGLARWVVYTPLRILSRACPCPLLLMHAGGTRLVPCLPAQAVFATMLDLGKLGKWPLRLVFLPVWCVGCAQRRAWDRGGVRTVLQAGVTRTAVARAMPPARTPRMLQAPHLLPRPCPPMLVSVPKGSPLCLRNDYACATNGNTGAHAQDVVGGHCGAALLQALRRPHAYADQGRHVHLPAHGGPEGARARAVRVHVLPVTHVSLRSAVNAGVRMPRPSHSPLRTRHAAQVDHVASLSWAAAFWAPWIWFGGCFLLAAAVSSALHVCVQRLMWLWVWPRMLPIGPCHTLTPSVRADAFLPHSYKWCTQRPALPRAQHVHGLHACPCCGAHCC